MLQFGAQISRRRELTGMVEKTIGDIKSNSVADGYFDSRARRGESEDIREERRTMEE